jgi:hypothetical protein
MPIALVAAVGAALWWFGVWPFSSYTYRPEVGYYAGNQQKWHVGRDYNTQDECTSEAAAVFNSYNRQSPGRAFSWACRKMDGEAFLERVR